MATTHDHVLENAEIARLFRDAADLLEIGGANTFRVRAYRTAARTVEEQPDSVARLAREHPEALTELHGIGDDLAGKIAEIAETGSFALLRQLERRATPGARELLRVPGVGPKRARTLARRLHVRSVAGLARAARAGRIQTLEGFGAQTEQKILRELGRGGENAPVRERRTLRAVAAQYAEPVLEYLRAAEGVERAELAGSFRRGRETVGDLDILVSSRLRAPIVERFVAYPEVKDVIARGTTRASVRLRSGLQIDLRILGAESYGAALHYFTGSKPHNIAVRHLGQRRGLRISEYGVFRGTRRIAGREEPEVFAAVGLPWIPPELREDRGELDAARGGTLPTLLELSDIRGDLQMHTTASDGRDTLEAMCEAAQAIGYQYIAITDHSPSVRIARGLDAAGFRRQITRIERLNAKLHGLTVLAGAEVDIHEDGTLDLDDHILAALDVVIVSLHAKLGLSAEHQTRRLVRALQHPSVDILAHPTGRLLGTRAGATFDLDEVCRVASDRGVMLEVNAQPDRLDLDDLSSRAAIERGVTLVVNTDAHSALELRTMRWGVDQARRGWVEKRHVANTRPLAQLRKRLHGAR